MAHGDSARAVFQSGTVKSSALALAVAVERTEQTIVERAVATYGIARYASQSLRTSSAASIAASWRCAIISRKIFRSPEGPIFNGRYYENVDLPRHKRKRFPT